MGQSYRAAYSDNAYLRVIWGCEKNILDDIISAYCGNNSPIRLLDFACGTGRILNYLKDRTRVAIGVDISRSMLEVARRDIPDGNLIEADLTEHDVLGGITFNLITAFRFFPNAQPPLRRQAMGVLRRHLDENGYLVFNNHKNTVSARNRLARLCGRRGFSGMSPDEVTTLLTDNKLKLVRVYALGIFPASENRLLLPVWALRALETALSRVSLLRNYGQNLIFVCRPDRSGG